MLGERAAKEIVKEQFRFLLSTIDSYNLSYRAKMEILTEMQVRLNEQVVQNSINYGQQLERKKPTPKKETTQNVLQFTEKEEQFIENYINYFRENGVDKPINFVFQPNDRDNEILEEAKRRYNSFKTK